MPKVYIGTHLKCIIYHLLQIRNLVVIPVDKYMFKANRKRNNWPSKLFKFINIDKYIRQSLL